MRKTVVVLVSGAFYNPMALEPMAQGVQEAGVEAVIMTYPQLDTPEGRQAMTLEAYSDRVVEVVQELGDVDITLFLHSSGGQIGMHALRRLPNVTCVVTCSAFLLPSGQSQFGLLSATAPEEAREEVSKLLAAMTKEASDSDDMCVTAPYDFVRKMLMPEVLEEVARKIYDEYFKDRRQPIWLFLDPAHESSGDFRRVALICTQDNSGPYPPLAQAFGADFMQIEAGHMAPVTKAKLVASKLVEIVRGDSTSDLAA